MLKHWLQFLWLIFPMFAAGAVAEGAGGGGGDGAGAGADDGTGTGGSDGTGAGDGSTDGSADGTGTGDDLDLDTSADPDAQREAEEARQREQEQDKDTSDFKGLVSKRLVALKKDAPELTAIFQKYPKVQEQIEASFRRDMAYRELYPTIAEARQMREQFPNGMADVEQLLTDVTEVEELDRGFYGRDAQGQYTQHPTLIQNWYQDDPEAMRSLFRTAVQLMPRLDQDTYREVGSSIVGATLAQAELPELLSDLVAAADDPKNLAHIKTSLSRILRWSQGFAKRRTEPTEEERRIQGQREQFKRETDERARGDQQRFRSTLNTDSHKLQQQIIRKHPAVAALLTTKALSDQKKAEIIGKIQTAVQNHLKNSRAFISKYKTALQAGNMKECMDLQRVAWNYPWVLNKFVRQVMAAETPNLVRQNRERAGQQRTQVQTQRNSGKEGTQEQKRTKPYQEGNRWYKANGQPFTTAEILRGVHLQGQ